MLTEEEFIGKVGWEGGVIAALAYGLKPADCEPGEVRDAWEKIHTLYWSDEFQEALQDAEDLTEWEET